MADSIWDAMNDAVSQASQTPEAKKQLTDEAAKAYGDFDEEFGSDEQRELNAEINAYKQMTDLNKQMLDEKRNEEVAEKRRINEKQIRALRGRYRAAGGGTGFLGTGSEEQQGESNKLGG